MRRLFDHDSYAQIGEEYTTMIRRFCNVEGWHEARKNLVRCGFRILAALAPDRRK